MVEKIVKLMGGRSGFVKENGRCGYRNSAGY
jgi:hypothetical protein